MGENLLSHILLQKLGHPMEEIRVRALCSVISKFTFGLVDEEDKALMKMLLEKLFSWFSFPKPRESLKVLKLILRILKNVNITCSSDTKFNEFLNNVRNLKEIKENNDLKTVLDEIKAVAGINDTPRSSSEVSGESKTFKVVAEITPCYSNHKNTNGHYENVHLQDRTLKTQNNKVCESKSWPMVKQHPKCYISEVKIETIETNIGDDVSNKPVVSVSETLSGRTDSISSQSSGYLIQNNLLQWQSLISADVKVLSTVFDGLRYLDDRDKILHSCYFFKDIVLKDFPAEVFLQRPIIITTLLELLIRGDKQISLAVAFAIQEWIHCLKIRIQYYIDSSTVNSKNTKNLDFKSDNSCQSPNFNHTTYSSDFEDSTLEHLHQLDLRECLFNILEHVITHLSKENSQHNYNHFTYIMNETASLVLLFVDLNVLKNDNILKQRAFRMLTLFEKGMKFHNKLLINHVNYINILCAVINILHRLMPFDDDNSSDILPKSLQLDLVNSTTNVPLVICYPHLHSYLIMFCKFLPGHVEIDAVKNLNETNSICKSMKSAIKFFKNFKHFKSRQELLECINQAIHSLDYHQNFNLVSMFLELCFSKFKKSSLSSEEQRTVEEIFLKFLSHPNLVLKVEIYKNLHVWVKNLLNHENKEKYVGNYLGDSVDYMFTTAILTEIICHGATSRNKEVAVSSHEILYKLLNCQKVVSTYKWEEFLAALKPSLGLLQCLADKTTKLGVLITKIFDPDLANSISLPFEEVLKGNLRLLFCKDNLVREEAMTRLCFILTKEDKCDQKLPKISLILNLNLSNMCVVNKIEQPDRFRPYYYSVGSLCQIIETLHGVGVETELKRSALSQINLMLEDFNLHHVFLEQRGLDPIMDIYNNCLVEKEVHNYPDSVLPIVGILKNLAYHNVHVRQELSANITLYYLLLRSLLLFNGVEKLRQDGAELLCLLLYNDNILSGSRCDEPTKGSLSLPEVIVTRTHLPFYSRVHWRESPHALTSMRGVLMKDKNSSSLLRTFWAVQWLGNMDTVVLSDVSTEAAVSDWLPEDMRIKQADIDLLKSCMFLYVVKQKLYDVQNATSHSSVNSAVDCLYAFVTAYRTMSSLTEQELAPSECLSPFTAQTLTDSELSALPWEITLDRFLVSPPSTYEDECLLTNVLRLVNLLLRTFDTCTKLHTWIVRVMTDRNMSLSNLMNVADRDEELGIVGREIRQEIVNLLEIVAKEEQSQTNCWSFYVEIIVKNLQLKNDQQFFNVAYLDWFLTSLVHLTGSNSWESVKDLKLHEKVVANVLNVLLSFQSIQKTNPSFMGVGVVRNCLIILNHLLHDGQGRIKGWEQLWSRCMAGNKDTWLLCLTLNRDVLVRAAAVQLLTGFSQTERGCVELVEDSLGIDYSVLWSRCFQLLLDTSESCLVRERSCDLLSNLISYGTKDTTTEFLQQLSENNFYQEMGEVISKLYLHVTVRERIQDTSISTPGLVRSVCRLLLNLLCLNSQEITRELAKFSILTTLLSVLDRERLLSPNYDELETLEMYTSLFKLVWSCIVVSSDAYSCYLRNRAFINASYSLLDVTLYGSSEYHKYLRKNLWREIFTLFSVTLTGTEDQQTTTTTTPSPFNVMKTTMLNNTPKLLFDAILSVSVEQSTLNLLTALFNLENEDNLVWLRTVLDANTECGSELASMLISAHLACKKDVSVCRCLGSLVAVSQTAKCKAVDDGVLDACVQELRELSVKLNLEEFVNSRKPTDKKKFSSVMQRVEMLLELLSNLMYQCDHVKKSCVRLGLADVVHKLWTWVSVDVNLTETTLKLLSTFTSNSVPACQSLATTSASSSYIVKKLKNGSTLLQCIINKTSTELDLISKTHDLSVLELCLLVLENSCTSTECRHIMCKDCFLQNLKKLHPDIAKKRFGWNSVVKLWFSFVKVLTSYQEGQLAVPKDSDVLDCLISSCRNFKSLLRKDALTIFKNLSFHQMNKIRFLTSGLFLNLIHDVLMSNDEEEIKIIIVIIWSLIANNQKAKLILKTSGLEPKLLKLANRVSNSCDLELKNTLMSVVSALHNR